MIPPGVTALVDDAGNLRLRRAVMAIDPILLEVLRNRLDAIADEMELTLLKSAASPIVKEGLDASAALFNTPGETIAQAAAIPIHLGRFSSRRSASSRAFPPERMREGDAFLLNDPYDGGTHLPDITIAVPVFADGRVGGAGLHDVPPPGHRRPHARQRADRRHRALPGGLIIPPTQLFRAGELDENLFRLLTRNVRLPDVFTGDLMAQLAAGRLGGRPAAELFAAHGARHRAGLHRRAARAGRAAHPRPDRGDPRRGLSPSRTGSTTMAWTSGGRVKIAVTLRVRGSAMTFDFTGSDPQVRGPFNSVPASTMSAVYYAVRAISDPPIPNNGGCFRAVDAMLPGGNDREPAAARRR